MSERGLRGGLGRKFLEGGGEKSKGGLNHYT